MVYDSESGGVSRIDTASAGFEREGDKYLGAVAVGKCVYFVPYQVSKVGGVCCA